MSSNENPCDEFNKVYLDFETLRPSLRQSIEKIIKREYFTQHEVRVEYLQTNGNNFLGKLYEINIKGTTTEGEKEVSIFLKDKITLENIQVMDSDQLYKNEEMIYKQISKIITKLQDQANVPPEVRFKLPGAYDETSNETIILENLCKKGFKIYSKSEYPPLRFMELGVQELAKFHALSFVIENKMPEFFKEKITSLHNSLNIDDDSKEVLRNVCKYVANLCDGETKMKFEKFIPIVIEKFPKYFCDKTNICTLSHGDYRKSNVMYRMHDGEPGEVMIIDYQLIDYGCPIRDLLFFIFGATDKEFRRKHLNDLKWLYFETLSSFLDYFDMDVEAVYPRREFEKVYTERLDYGLMVTLFFAVVLFAPDAGIDFQNLPVLEFPFCPDERSQDALRGLVEEFVEWGYL